MFKRFCFSNSLCASSIAYFEMSFIGGTIIYWYHIWLIAVPVMIFSVKPNAPEWLKSARILLLFFVFLFFCALGIDWQECFSDLGDPCGGPQIFIFVFGGVPLLMSVGLCEFLWRVYYKQPLLKRGLVGSAAILCSFFVSVFLAVILILNMVIFPLIRH
jgi:hypothetical protein